MSELQNKLATLINEKLKDEDKAVKDLILGLLTAAQSKQDIATMEMSVRKILDSEIEKGIKTGILDYDADDPKYDVF